ncbi:MAG: hypothetical protein ACR2I0_13960 [Rhodoferax sp.]
MFSAFRGKGANSADAPPKEAGKPRGLEVIEDDPDTAWGLWDSALAEQDSQFLTDPSAAMAGPASGQVPSANAAAVGLASPPSVPAAPVAAAPSEASDPEAPTLPIGLEPQAPPALSRKDEAMATVDLHHHRIANTISTLWGYRECSDYIYKLILSGGDGMGHARVGFNQDAAAAMLVLAELHDAEFGHAARDIGFAGLDKPR